METVEKTDYFNVYNMRYAGKLMSQGYRPLIVRNNKDSRYYIFKFRNTKEFQEAFQKLVG